MAEPTLPHGAPLPDVTRDDPAAVLLADIKAWITASRDASAGSLSAWLVQRGWRKLA